MDAETIKHFVKSVKSVFETMVHTKMTVGKPHLKTNDDCADVSGIIGFSGDAAGCVVICFDNETAEKAASSFAGVTITRDHEDFADAIGELANMVAGAAKRDFKDMEVKISLPSVIMGEKFHVANSRNVPRIIIPCTCHLGQVNVEIAMERTSSATTAAAQTSSAGA